MKLSTLILLIPFVSCSPNFQSGKTQCSDKGACPSGFICSDNGAGATPVCVNTPTTCAAGAGYFCPASGTCWRSKVECSTVANCGTSASPNYKVCPSAGSHPACNGTDACVPNSGTGGSGGGGTIGPGGSGGGGTSGFGGISGIGGTGGTSASAGSSGSTSACSLSDLPSRGSCNVLPACGCPAGNVCYPATESLGLICTVDSKLGNGADCSSAVACASGFGCFGGICSKYCEFDSDCPMVDMTQGCLQTYWANGDEITGVSVCAEICDPVSPQRPTAPLVACPPGFGCSADIWGDSSCEKQAGTGVTNSSCTDDTDCVPGYFCDTTGLSCVKYCYTINDCPTGTTCGSFSSSYYAGSSEVGYCY
jgi:hypothetical protein